MSCIDGRLSDWNYLFGMESIADLGAIILLCIALYLISHANKWLESGRWLLAGPAVLTKKYVSI